MPKIIGRDSDGNEHERASTVSGPQTSIEFVSGVEGTAKVQIFTSVDDEDRGGVVFRFEIDDQNYSFIPFARNTEKGVELHFAGEAEAESLINALKGVLAAGVGARN